METLWFQVQKFLSTLKYMALKLLNQEQPKKKEIQVKDPSLDLTQPEIELVLRLLSQTTFQVKDIETLYITLYKLQEQHKHLQNNQ